MKSIKSKYITISLVCVVLLAAGFTAGFSRWIFFVPAISALIAYVVIDKKHLRCPNCGGFINLANLLAAKTRRRHCPHCGELLLIK